MDSSLIEPSSFDLIVYGTGLIESVIAAYVLMIKILQLVWTLGMIDCTYLVRILTTKPPLPFPK